MEHKSNDAALKDAIIMPKKEVYVLDIGQR